MIEFKDYFLKIGKKELLNNVNVIFENGKIHHILGGNGVGKSSFAKTTIKALPYKGDIITNNKILLIGSYTNLPKDLTIKNILEINKDKMNNILYDMLDISNININYKLSKLSDGQKQKIKLLFFLSTEPAIIILDEFTSALDKKSMMETYKFINEYIKKYNITIINITHNLIDLENLDGKYWYMKNKTILEYTNKESIINDYVNLV